LASDDYQRGPMRACEKDKKKRRQFPAAVSIE
jgi:hypothetical protein